MMTRWRAGVNHFAASDWSRLVFKFNLEPRLAFVWGVHIIDGTTAAAPASDKPIPGNRKAFRIRHITYFNMQRCTRFCVLACTAVLAAGLADAQQAEPGPVDATATVTPDSAEIPAQPAPPDKRIFGVLPNYRTVNGLIDVEPITARQKFTIAAKDSFDWPGYILAGAFSGLSQLDNVNPSFGQGIKGYARRYATAYADQVIGNMMTEGALPSLLREDPRYFRRGSGSFWSRITYSATRVLVTRTDSGNWRFNTSEILGNGITASIANTYYPGARGATDTFQRVGTQVGTDAISNVLKEFWPDVKRRFFRRD